MTGSLRALEAKGIGGFDLRAWPLPAAWGVVAIGLRAAFIPALDSLARPVVCIVGEASVIIAWPGCSMEGRSSNNEMHLTSAAQALDARR